MSQHIFICRAHPSDIPQYARHLQSLALEDLAQLRLEKMRENADLPIEDALRLDMDQGDWFYLAFNRRDLPVGALHARDREGQNRVEITFSVLPEYRGNGIASSLMEKAFLHARNQGKKTISLRFGEGNEYVRSLARNAGMAIRKDADGYVAARDLAPGDPCSLMFEAGMEATQRNLRQYATTTFPPLSLLLSWQERFFGVGR